MTSPIPFPPLWRPTNPGIHDSGGMQLDAGDAGDAGQPATARTAATMHKLMGRFGEDLRLRQAVQAATDSGREEGFRVGWGAGARWGLGAGAVVGAITAVPVVWAAPRVLQALAGWLA